jgi:hypothetical protein
LCGENCHPDALDDERIGEALDSLRKTGKIREQYIMKRKEKALEVVSNDEEFADDNAGEAGEENSNADSSTAVDNEFFLIGNDGKLQPLSPAEYTPATIFQAVETFVVERKFVKPEDPGNIVYEGKKPSRKTMPILITREGEHIALDSWEALEANPEQLANASEVIGATTVKQVFVLRKK